MFVDCVLTLFFIENTERLCLTADFCQHLVYGLFDVCGGAPAARLALYSPSATHLATQLVKSLGHASARAHLIRARRALVKRTGHVCRQPLALLRRDLTGVFQIRFISQQHQRDVFGSLDLVQETLQRRHVLEAPAVCDVVHQNETVRPAHVTLLLQHILLTNNNKSFRLIGRWKVGVFTWMRVHVCVTCPAVSRISMATVSSSMLAWWRYVDSVKMYEYYCEGSSLYDTGDIIIIYWHTCYKRHVCQHRRRLRGVLPSVGSYSQMKRLVRNLTTRAAHTQTSQTDIILFLFLC